MVLVVAFAATDVSTAAEPAWQLSFTVQADHVILREPIWTLVAVTNLSGEVVPQAGLYGDLYLDGAERPCRRESLPQFVPPAGGQGSPTRPMAPPGATVEAWLELGDECGLASAGESALGSHRVCYRDELSTNLRSTSACVSFVIETPRGIDKEAYEAFGHDPLADSERYGELLRRFPTSTYVAYAVWKQWGRVRIPEWKTEEDRDATLKWLATNPDDEYLTWRLPCAAEGEPNAALESRLGARRALMCRDDWLTRVLQEHPRIWFADEVRLRIALDHYRLGERDSGVRAIRDLAQHGRPYVAAKAAELLAALQAKGMLEEATK